jgi:hypothetical protein
LRIFCFLHGGGREIRTPGGSLLNGFQDRRLQPLGHPSGSSSYRTLLEFVRSQFALSNLSWI